MIGNQTTPATQSTFTRDAEEYLMEVEEPSEMNTRSTEGISSNNTEGINPEASLQVLFRGTSSEVGLMQYVAEYIKTEQTLKKISLTSVSNSHETLKMQWKTIDSSEVKMKAKRAN